MLSPYTCTVTSLLQGMEEHAPSYILAASTISACAREQLGHPAREEARLANLAYLDVVRPTADEVLQGLVDEVRSIFHTDLCMVNLLTNEVQYFRAWSGNLPKDLVEARQDPRDRSMCQYVVDTEMPLVVHDFLATEQFRDQHFCVNYGIRFYAGTPLITSEGVAIGSLCLLHAQPREFTESDTLLLGIFARAVVARLELLGSLTRERVLYSAREELYTTLQASTQDEAEHTAARLRHVLDSSVDTITIVGFDGRIQIANPSCRQLLGYEPAELVGKHYTALIHPEDLARVRQTVAEAADQTPISGYQNRCITRDGSVVWGEWNGTPLPEEGAWYCLTRDISERKRSEAALRQSEARHRAVVDTASDAIITMTADGMISSFNKGAERIFGYQAEAMVGRPMTSLMPERYRSAHSAGLQRYMRSGKGRVVGHTLELEAARADGTVFPIELTVTEVAGVEECFFTGVIRDITERKRAQVTLRQSEERWRSLVQNSSDVVAVLGPDGVTRYVSDSIQRILGYNPEDQVATGVFDSAILHPDDAFQLRAALQDLLLTPGADATLEFRLWHADGSWRYVEAIARNLIEDPSVGGVVVNYRDITERKAFEEQLRRQAFHDPLTGLPNRALFADRLEHALARTTRRRQLVAVLYLDLDRFKFANDSLGHDVGDQILIEVGSRLHGVLRSEDTAARLGGDEFVVLIEEIEDRIQVMNLADRICCVLNEPFLISDHEVSVTASIGIAFASSTEATAVDLLRAADVAMYQAKNSGKARYKVFDPEFGASVLERLGLEADLRRALDRGELRVYYQPQVVLSSGRIRSAEALVRWEHPVRGLVSPGEFIPLAEETGLIAPIGAWVLREACRQASAWQHLGDVPITVGVNLSTQQLQQPDLIPQIVYILEETGLPPHLLQLEITESMLMQDVPTNVATLQQLRDMGVSLALDNFGTGYSSLSYLRLFPMDTLKIDKSFVDGLGKNPQDQAVLEAMISLARSFGMTVVAEGVETEQQAVLLQELECAKVQGFLFARPLRPEAVAPLLHHTFELAAETQPSPA